MSIKEFYQHFSFFYLPSVKYVFGSKDQLIHYFISFGRFVTKTTVSDTYEVVAGDTLTVVVSNGSSATITFEAAETGPVEDANLTFLIKSISFEEYIGLQYIITGENHDRFDKVYVTAVQSTPDGDVTETLEPTYYYGFYVFDKQIFANAMTDMVTLTLCGEKDGVVYQGEVVNTSVELTALPAIASFVSNNNLKSAKVLVDMLNYGAEVQKAFKINIENLPNRDLGDYASYGTAEDPSFVNNNASTGSGTVNPYTMAFNLGAQVELQLIFNQDMTGYTVHFTMDGGETQILNEFSDYYGFDILVIPFAPYNMRGSFTIEVYDADNNLVSKTYTGSMEGYAMSWLSNSYADAVKAMMKYCDAVSAYIN